MQVVMMEKNQSKYKKPFLGGWRHKLNGAEYLNAESQTGPAPKKIPLSSMLSREIQCVESKENSSQTVHHQATQMWRPDCCIPNEKDRYLSIKPYESYEQMQSRLDFEGHARIIQKYYRSYKIRMFIKESAKLYRELLENSELEEEESKAKLQKRFREEIIRKAYPRSRLDFDMLYNLIDVWKRIQTNDITKRYFKAGQLAMQYSLLETTISMLNNVEKQRQIVRDDCREKKEVKFITINCQPVRWIGYKGIPIEMVTLKTQKAQEHKQIYDDLKKLAANFEEREKSLLNLKDFLKNYNGYAVEELNYLVDQEFLLLSRRIKGLTLNNLRNRIISAFLNFSKSSELYGKNDDSLSNQTLEKLREPLETKTLWCNRCKKLLPRRKFSSHVRMRKLTQCKSCAWLTKKNLPHINYDHYSFILREIRSEEQRMNCFSSLAYVIQEPDIYHLVNYIWHGRSILSENNDLYILRLIRFDVNAEWSPWNCILLTEDEAKTHYRIENVESLYSKSLLQSVYLNHLAAKFKFNHIIQLHAEFLNLNKS